MPDQQHAETLHFLAFAEQLGDAARPIAMQYFRSALQIETKSDSSPVTIADRAIEAEMRGMISQRFPEPIENMVYPEAIHSSRMFNSSEFQFSVIIQIIIIRTICTE